MDYLIFSAMRLRKPDLFCTICHHNVPYKKQQELNNGVWTLKWVSLQECVNYQLQ